MSRECAFNRSVFEMQSLSLITRTNPMFLICHIHYEKRTMLEFPMDTILPSTIRKFISSMYHYYSIQAP
jgi:hypothetical protein